MFLGEVCVSVSLYPNKFWRNVSPFLLFVEQERHISAFSLTIPLKNLILANGVEISIV